MKILNLVQGSPEWHQHRATAFNASDAPAMLGISKYKTRSQLIKERATGIIQEVDDATQRRFNDGHRFEALARPLAEEIIGEELSPVTGAEGKYSASFDGITFDRTVIYEHKSMNAELRAILQRPGAGGAGLDEQYQVQMEQQLMVSGAEKCLFMATTWDAGDELIESGDCWYYPNTDIRARIVAGWAQFEKDIAAYSPAEEAQKVTAEAVMALPSLAVQIKGEVTASNLPVFVSAADTFLARIKTVLETDQDFADAEANVKACKAAEDGIEQTKKAITAQATSIDEVMRTMDLYKQKLSDVRLKLDKLVKSEKVARKEAIAAAARKKHGDHLTALEAEIKPIRIYIANMPDFAGAMSGLKKLSAMQEAVDTALRDSLFTLDAAATDYRAKLAWCRDNAAGQSALFPDLQALMAKPFEDFTLTITSRIEKQKAEEAARMEAVRAQAEADARTKLEAEAKAKADAEAAAQREADAVEERRKAVQLAEQARQNTPPEAKNGMAAVAQPAAVSRMEPAAPVIGMDMAKPGSDVTMVSITKAEYDRLVERDDWLGWLEVAGVDNWQGIDEAYDMRRKAQEASA